MFRDSSSKKNVFRAALLGLGMGMGAGCLPSSHSPPVEITVAADGSTERAKVAIEGIIDEETALAVMTVASTLPRELDVTIDSPGGLNDAADMIVRTFRSLRSTGAVVKCRVHNQAKSAAFWILQACSVREAESSASLMIHDPGVRFKQNALLSLRELVGIVILLERDAEKIAAVIAPRMHLTVTDYRAKVAQGDWVMTPAEAIANHALDSVI